MVMSALVPKGDIQAAFGYHCWWARVLKFVEHRETSPSEIPAYRHRRDGAFGFTHDLASR